MLETVQPEIRKVCGITQPADALHAVKCGANAIGMIFYAGSPRAVRVSHAAMIAAIVPSEVRRVGVFVDEDPETIVNTVSAARLDVVQLQGTEAPDRCAWIRDELPEGVEIWKAVRVGAGFRAAELEAFNVNAFLLDTAKGGVYGGTGETFPWPLALDAKQYGKVVVSGGLDGANVAEAIRKIGPWGVDASSRLEKRPGVKDPDKVRDFLAAASGFEPITLQVLT